MTTKDWLSDYWLEHHCSEACTLCGNSGVVDTTGVRTRVEVGRRNWCICPNGVRRREANGALQ
jgi:uncharacterized protein CbrC (UPF0167 family)